MKPKKKITVKKSLKISTKKIKSISIYDIDHPFRRASIEIIKNLLEPLIQKGALGNKYYRLEDDMTLILNRRLDSLLKTPIKPDLTETKKRPYNDIIDEDDDYDDDDDECRCNTFNCENCDNDNCNCCNH